MQVNMKTLFRLLIMLPLMPALVSCGAMKKSTNGKNSLNADVLQASGISVPSGQDAYRKYIETYSGIAVEQMKKYGVPASITLAQGILESDAGRSSLAVGCYNHFGIKCHSDWQGMTMYKDDDASHECFRCYESDEESFRDHSLFLVNGKRYSSLFSLDPTDYKGWARGLKEAGYATSPIYAGQLIDLIERYGLDEYDRLGKAAVRDDSTQKSGSDSQTAGIEKTVSDTLKNGIDAEEPVEIAVAGMKGSHEILMNNGCRCVRFSEGDRLKEIARAYDMSEMKLRSLNDMQRKQEIPAGTLVYLDKKKKRAEREYRTHVVSSGDSFWLISQRYGIRLNSMMHRNSLDKESLPQPGMVLKLR